MKSGRSYRAFKADFGLSEFDRDFISVWSHDFKLGMVGTRHEYIYTYASSMGLFRIVITSYSLLKS